MLFQIPPNTPNLLQIRTRCSSNPADTWASMGPGAEQIVPLTGSAGATAPPAPQYALFSTILEDSGDYLSFASGILPFVSVLNAFKLIVRLENINGDLSPGVSVQRAATTVPTFPPSDMLLDLTEIPDPGAPAAGVIRIYAKTDHQLYAWVAGVEVSLAVTTAGLAAAVALQGGSPGTQQGGHLNINGNGIFGTAIAIGAAHTIDAQSMIDAAGNSAVDGTTPTQALLTAYGSGSGGGLIVGRQSDITTGAPSPSGSNRRLIAMSGRGRATSAFSASSNVMFAGYTAEVFSDTNQGTYATIETTLKGTTTQLERVRVDDAGLVGIGVSAPVFRLDIKNPAAGTDVLGWQFGGNAASRNWALRPDFTTFGDFVLLTSSTKTSAQLNTLRWRVNSGGSIVPGSAALATNATDGFVYIQTCAGTPTGTPTTETGRVPIIWDSTNHKLYVFDGSWRGGTAPGVFT